MLLPGPEATQLAVYIGWLMHKTRGGIMAGVLFVFPSLLILIALSWIYLAYGSLPVVAGVLYGIKPAIVAVVLGAAYRIGSRTLKNATLMGIALAAFLAITFLAVPFPLIVLTAAAIGMAGGRLLPAHFQVGGAHPGKQASYGLALIDDDTAPPAHAAFTWLRLGKVALAGVLLGGGAWLLLAWQFGADTALAQMGWFFTKAAMMTFGGAYAVLPYVYQGGVEHYHWLSASQMIDGLALGETTPGPLIMIVAFVGFVGAGVAGATVATFFTFLPSFIFILAGGPLVESTRDNVRMTAPLTAISAAVVGVIVSLAVFFGQHVFVAAGKPDWAAIAISALACIALFRFKAGTIKLIVGCALAGLVLSYWHG